MDSETCDKIISTINEKIAPFSLNKKGEADIACLTTQYSYELLVDCINIGVSRYFQYDENGQLTEESVIEFLNKLGGIAFNQSKSPIDKEILHLINCGNAKFNYWDKRRATEIITRYVEALQKHMNEDEIVNDLKGDALRLMNNSQNWSQWVSNMENWIEEVNNWSEQNKNEH